MTATQPRRVSLNLKAMSDAGVRAIAGTTLKPLLDAEEQARAERVANPDIGDRMPDGSVFAGCTADGARLFAMPENASALLDFNQAAAYAQKLSQNSALGHDDWRVPTAEELDVLFNNRAKIGGLEQTDQKFPLCFWSGSAYGDDTYALQYFHDGSKVGASPPRRESVRAVRSVPGVRAPAAGF